MNAGIDGPKGEIAEATSSSSGAKNEREVQMNKEDVKPGDKVKTRAGEAEMIYLGEGRQGLAVCAWIAEDGTGETDLFEYAEIKNATITIKHGAHRLYD